MQPRIVTVGPLVAASNTKVALAQTVAAAGYLALNGAAGTAVANNICASQSGTAATALVINGALAQTQFVSPTIGNVGAKIAALPTVQPIYITSAGNDSAITFAVVGMDINNATLTETIHGTNASVSASANSYKAILSVTPSGNTASTVSVGAIGLATLDTARRVIFVSSGTDTGLTISISGSDWAGLPISETVTGGSSGVPATTRLDYLTVAQVNVSGATAGTMSVGTSGVAGSEWVNLDIWSYSAIAIQCTASGTVNYTVQQTLDDPASYANPVLRSSVTWVNSGDTNAVGATGSVQTNYFAPPTWSRVLLNSGTGSVTATYNQAGSVTL